MGSKTKNSEKTDWFWRNYGDRATWATWGAGTRRTHRFQLCNRAGHDERLQRCEQSQPPTFENLKSQLSGPRVVVDLARAFEKVRGVAVGS